jgi:hypothetical protein
MDSMPHDRLDLHFSILDDAHALPKSYRRTAGVTSDEEVDEEEDEESEQRLVQYILQISVQHVNQPER